MNVDRLKTPLAVGLVILIFLVVTVLAWNFVRDTIAMPIYYVLWVGGLILKSIPQSTYLILLVLLCIVITVATFQGMRISPASGVAERTPEQSHTRYLLWRTLSDHLSTSRYFREQFAAESRKLILATLAYQEGVEVAEAEMMVNSGALLVPEAVKVLIGQKEIRTAPPPSTSLKNRLFRLRHSLFHRKLPHDAQLDSQIAEIIGYMEHLLEIDHAGNQAGSAG